MAQDSGTGQYPDTPTPPKSGHWSTSQNSLGKQRAQSQNNSPDRSPTRPKPLPSLPQHSVTLQETPASPVSINPPNRTIQEPETASLGNAASGTDYGWPSQSSGRMGTPESGKMGDSIESLPTRSRPGNAGIRGNESQPHSRQSSMGKIDEYSGEVNTAELPPTPGLQYSAFDDAPKKRVQNRASQMTFQSSNSGSSSGGEARHTQQLNVPKNGPSRPVSTYTLGSELRGRTLTPMSANGSDMSGSPRPNNRRSPSLRPMSYVDLLSNVPYNQQHAPTPLNNQLSGLRAQTGSAASLLDTKKTLEMYRANVKKTNDTTVQYEFALFMVNTARDAEPEDGIDAKELISDAKHILQRLSDRAYPFAQYYLGDGYFSGLFNKDKPDHDKAFPLFVAASKHGHAEAGYRAALCYEFGWGTTKSYPKAVQFFRSAASRSHPGAASRLGLACIRGDMGLGKSYHREGIKWLKRAQEAADPQYNSAPYELGLLHLTGSGEDIFKDEAYAAQLFTQSAELGHAEANLLMGRAYENGLYMCPRDAALSVHFYNGAATRGNPEAMMALCAWYMLGAPPVLEKDEAEAYQWAHQAAELGYPKAEYACGYFTEMGIGCRRDPLQANVWYVAAADRGNETAKQRLAIIRDAAAGDPGIPMTKAEARSKELAGSGRGKGGRRFMGLF
ncbi:hypothetical protein MBLNU230_g1105t1 [Neophaeotheca triangularis]